MERERERELKTDSEFRSTRGHIRHGKYPRDEELHFALNREPCNGMDL